MLMQRGIHALPSVDRIGEHLEGLPLQVEHIDNVSQGSYVCGVAWILCNGAYDVEVILSHGEAELFERDAVGDGTNRPVDESKRPDVRHCQLANDVAEDLYRESFKGPHLDFHFPSRPVTMLTVRDRDPQQKHAKEWRLEKQQSDTYSLKWVGRFVQNT
jgi:hypothetical protein